MVARRARTATAESTGTAFFDKFQSRVKKNKGLAELIIRTAKEERELITNVYGWIPTGNVAINRVMHLPGVPMGRIIGIRGNFMGGKSTIAEHICAEAQKMGGMIVYIDTEYALDLERVRLIGMSTDPEQFVHPEVETIEEVTEIIKECIEVTEEERANGIDRPVVIVWDSVGGTATKSEMEDGKATPGEQARLVSRLLRRNTARISKNNITLILIGQERDKMSFSQPGMPQPTTIIAERPIMFHSTIVLRPMKTKTLTNSAKEPIGVKARVECMKNKLAAPFARTEVQIDFGPPWSRNTGLNNLVSLLEIALNEKMVKKGASGWYSFGEEKFQAREFASFLKEFPELQAKLDAFLELDQKRNAKDFEHDDAGYEDAEDEDEDEDEDDDD